MLERPLNINSEKHHPIILVRLSGYLAQLEVYKLKSQMEGFAKESFRFAIIDLSALTFIDSAGIGVLTQLRSDLMRNGGQVVLVQPQAQQVAQAIQTVGFLKLFDTFNDASLALDHLRKSHGLGMHDIASAGAANVTRLSQQVADLEARLRELEGRMQALEQNAR